MSLIDIFPRGVKLRDRERGEIERRGERDLDGDRDLATAAAAVTGVIERSRGRPLDKDLDLEAGEVITGYILSLARNEC
ncbi:MAG: hypothetical protein M1824_003679 [Vezdaea acicularis]|nr:MAG: hypothetical protein M1824_003679 [Vezdaea acicularis]